MAMVVLFLTIPLMVLGVAMAVAPLLIAMVRDRRNAVEPAAAGAATASGTYRSQVPAAVTGTDEAAAERQRVLVGV